jgi:dihydropteroate synthase
MDYHEAAEFLFGLRRYPPRPGIEPTAALLGELGDPQEDLRCVQVAGSNGKGTTARALAGVLDAAGLSVGLYTSPHLADVRERIRVDGRPVRRRAVVEFVDRVREYVLARGAAGESPTFFEAVTALALWEFDRQDVDVAVLEVGIGGRYDATSVVDPVASAVTSVALEHTDVLGDSVPEIARDLGNVAPESGPLVTAATGPALAPLRQVAGELLTVGTADADADDTARDVGVAYGGRRGVGESAADLAGEGWSVSTRLPTVGAHHAENAGVAAALARVVAGDRVDEQALARGIRGADWPGRFEVVGTDPLVVLDGAHNPAACRALAEALEEYDHENCQLVFGALTDKDHLGMARSLPIDDAIACSPDRDRAEDPAVLAGAVHEAGGTATVVDAGVETALDRALAAADPDDAVVVTGSLYTVAEARARYVRTYASRGHDGSDATGALARVGAPPERADDLDHHTLRVRVRPGTADRLATAFAAVGGRCLGDSPDDTEFQEVLLAGTRAEFVALADRLGSAGGEPGRVAAELRARLSGQVPRAEAPTPATVTPPAESTLDAPWEDGPVVMGILNVTPDSFHDGGEYDTVAAARERAERLVEAGVGILDVGGESTRPGADPVAVEEEIDRVVPVIEAVADLEATVSVDTRKAAVARRAVEAGADLINDVSGLEDPEMRHVAAETGAGLVVMHSLSAPVDPDRDPTTAYDDVVADTLDELRERVLLAERAGVPRERILVDPGLGFGKTAAQSFELLDRLGEFDALDCPVMVGHSHKSMFGLVGAGPDERLAPTVAATALAADRGADVIRVHDGAENVAAVRTALAARDPGQFE